MRALIVTSLVAAGLVLSACSKNDAAEAPPPPKYMARSQQMYAGQEMLPSVSQASVERGARPGELVLKASATAPSAGYAKLAFLPRIYAAQPKDGVYEVDVVGDKPAGAAAAVVTPVEVKGSWDRYSDDRVKGITFIAKAGPVTAMLPPKS